MATAKEDVCQLSLLYLWFVGSVISYISTLQDILGHSDSFRRTWDTAKYEKLAKDRLKKEKEGSKSLSTG